MVFNDGAFWTMVDRERSNPEHHRRLSEILGGSREGVGPTRFMLEGQIPSRAEASRLRDAYLAAFALLGYRYILSEELDDVFSETIGVHHGAGEWTPPRRRHKDSP